MADIGVVIPFYQASAGVLTRALDAVFQQSVDDVTVVIVDDGSPHSPAAEVGARAVSERRRIQMVTQPNAGPGAARNRGLEALAADVRYIAFLDSDDVWAEGHLAGAVAALEQGFDFYFADYTWAGGDTSRFRQVDVTGLGAPSPADANVYAVDANFISAVLTLWPVHISATVIRRAALGQMRFDPRLRYSSEDQMFFIGCGTLSSRVCCRDQVMLRLDDGLNMFRRQDPGSRGFAKTRIANAYFHRLLAPLAANWPAALRRQNSRLIRANLRDFVRSEAKSLLRSGALHPSLYPAAARVFLAPQTPEALRLS